MRSRFDRIRHAIMFELIGLILIVGVLSQFGFEMGHVGIMGVVFSLVATGWNYVYNILFDKYMMRKTGTTIKSTLNRVVHSLGFEGGLLFLTIPAMAWFLNISLLEAFILDIGLVVFYLFYAYVYNLAYDEAFPINEIKQVTQ
ncbi:MULTISPECIES: PACE efflux transporter [Aliivibrio]|uniref:PACE efflux transporter n=1 Tax=Aliivibrio finisterrensis TaxID=511998 RepID=A0A4Q5KQE7_9GAMM|nr:MULTISPECIES: PACE efflux transporter [Aliivibrio]MDD9178747.1 PACE efflux transporter [Aliivibrio sp. A6]RYU48897.1 PACE efflux transporter [Aliivibrio finisterrensis]RYU55185.1 PACE efflux transporter [Aliivibrio finisterrensis]RYU59844.1 PACE efflux transporter [Aliivibrio finisterrensis]RYU65710.1 PACE efflux transporter [Aliivibrio finisterrensis]